MTLNGTTTSAPMTDDLRRFTALGPGAVEDAIEQLFGDLTVLSTTQLSQALDLAFQMSRR